MTSPSSTALPPKPRTFTADLTKLPPALLPLTRLQRRVIWKWQYRENGGDGVWTKPPFEPSSPERPAKANDPATWGTYEEAIFAFAQRQCDGIGLMLKDSDLGAIDLDHIRNFATGQVLRWAEEVFVEAANAGCYLEWTVSGAGARIIGTARGSELHRRININRKLRCAVEFYRHCARFITISGVQISGDYPGLPAATELPEYDTLLDALFARFCDSAWRPAPHDCEFGHALYLSIEEIPGENEDETTTEAKTQPDDAQSGYDFDFNDAGPQASGDDNDLIENGAPQGERSERFHELVWRLAGRGWSADEIAAELANHPNGIGAKYAGRLQLEVTRSYRKWQAHKRGAAGNGATGAAAGTPWPQIRVVAGEIPRVVAEAEDALLLLGHEIYQRGGLIVRPALTKFEASNKREAQGWQLVPVTRPYLVDVLTCAARFWKYNGRSNAWVAVDAPDKVAETYLARRGRWKLPVLTGIIHTPFLRGDGSICETPGYDSASGLLFKPDSEFFPSIPVQPDKNDAIEALNRLEKLIETFAFVSEMDWSVALSAILTILDRRSMPTAPLHALTSPTAGTGKSLLVDVCAMLATGRLMPVIAQGRSEEEQEKRLGAALLAGDTAVSLDNCEHTLEGSFLCQALTQPRLNIRILGQSRNADTPANATIFATGNNLELAGDVVRRALLCSMDAGCERPETRSFSVNAVEMAKRRRGELVASALTVLRAWHVAATSERRNLPAFGSFEEWSYRIREPLVWLGKIDPCETSIDIRENDPHRAALVTVIMQWEQHLQVGVAYTIQEVIEHAIGAPSFYMALMGVAAARSGGAIGNVQLGRWLKRVQGKIVHGFALLQSGSRSGYPLWKLIKH
jgi:hypothetical protein